MSESKLQDTLAEGVRECGPLFMRFVAGFDDKSRTGQAMNLPNHVAWALGHCALTMHRAAETIDARPLPDEDFILGEVEGNRERFGAEGVAIGSTPVDDPAIYPPLERSIAIYERACDRLAEAVRHATADQLQREIDWGPYRTTVRRLIFRMVFHNGIHAGQTVDLRRALGLPRVIQ